MHKLDTHSHTHTVAHGNNKKAMNALHPAKTQHNTTHIIYESTLRLESRGDTETKSERKSVKKRNVFCINALLNRDTL